MSASLRLFSLLACVLAATACGDDSSGSMDDGAGSADSSDTTTDGGTDDGTTGDGTTDDGTTDGTTDDGTTDDGTTDDGTTDDGTGGDPTGDGDGDGDLPDRTVRILPLGDSLTLGFGSGMEGGGSEGGYRLRLSQLLANDGIDFDLVGSNQNGPAALADKDHEGYNGYTVPQVAEVAATAVPMFDPDVVLLMAGTNDQIVFVPPSQPPADAAADMEALLSQINGDAPNAQIIIAQIIPLTFNDGAVQEYNSLLPGVVSRARDAGIPVQLVDMYAIGRENLSGDGIHPTAKGYDMIADIWYPALLEALADLP